MIVLMFLSGCMGSGLCIDASEIEYHKLRINVPAKPDVIDGDYRNYWVDSGVVVDNYNGIEFLMKDSRSVNFCANSASYDSEGNKEENEEDGEGISSTLIEVGAGAKNADRSIFLYEGDEIRFSLFPYDDNIKPSKKTCEKGHDDKIYVGSKHRDQCFEMVEAGITQTSDIGNYDGSIKANIWSSGAVPPWINGKLFIFDPESSGKLLQSNRSSLCSNLDDNSDTVKQNLSYLLNNICGRTCSPENNSICYKTFAPVKYDDPMEGVYAQGLRANILDTQHNILQDFELFGEGMPNDVKGVKLNHRYTAEKTGKLNLHLSSDDTYSNLVILQNLSNEPIDMKSVIGATSREVSKRKFWHWSGHAQDKSVTQAARTNAAYDDWAPSWEEALMFYQVRYNDRVLCEIPVRSAKKKEDRTKGDQSTHIRSSQFPTVHDLGLDEIPTIITVNSNFECSFAYGRGPESNIKSNGGYRVNVNRFCFKASEDSLYYYVGDNTPPVLPGHPGTIKVDLSGDNPDRAIPHKFKIGGEGSRKGRVYFGVKDNGDGYENNAGGYKMEAKVPKDVRGVISRIIRGIRDRILSILYGNRTNQGDSSLGVIGESVDNVTSSVSYARIAQAVIALYIAIYAISFMLGLLKTPQHELLIMLVKISIVVVMISPGAWGFFKYHIFDMFINGTSYLINVVTINLDANVDDFDFIDRFLYRFLVSETWLQVLSFLFAFPVGWIYFALIVSAIYDLFMAIFDALCIYFAALISIAIMLVLSPIFFLFILFKRTKMYFDAWLKSLIQSMMQPVFVFVGLALLLELSKGVINDLFNFSACGSCAMEVGAPGLKGACLFNGVFPSGYVSTGSIEGADPGTATGTGIGMFGLPIQFVSLILFYILSQAIKKFIHFASQMSLTIFGAPGADLEAAGQGIGESVKALGGQDQETSQGRKQEEESKEDKEGGARSVPGSSTDVPGDGEVIDTGGGKSVPTPGGKNDDDDKDKGKKGEDEDGKKGDSGFKARATSHAGDDDGDGEGEDSDDDEGSNFGSEEDDSEDDDDDDSGDDDGFDSDVAEDDGKEEEDNAPHEDEDDSSTKRDV